MIYISMIVTGLILAGSGIICWLQNWTDNNTKIEWRTETRTIIRDEKGNLLQMDNNGSFFDHYEIRPKDNIK